MARVLTFAGFLMTADEWDSLDESARLDYLEAFIATSPPRADDWAYESYELSFEPVYESSLEPLFESPYEPIFDTAGSITEFTIPLP